MLGQDGKPQARRIKIGLTDGASTEVVEGNLVEGEMVITGQTLSSASKSSNTNAGARIWRRARTRAWRHLEAADETNRARRLN